MYLLWLTHNQHSTYELYAVIVNVSTDVSSTQYQKKQQGLVFERIQTYQSIMILYPISNTAVVQIRCIIKSTHNHSAKLNEQADGTEL